MIYDSFLFFNELELLELRLHELDDVVDRFILVESDTTFSGKSKPLVFHENRKLFEKFLPKIIHVPVVNMPATTVTWHREIHQRNSILCGLPKDVSPDDVLIVADVDEIPKAETLRKILPVKSPFVLKMRSFGGYMNSPSGEWEYTKVAPVHAFRNNSPQDMRHATHRPVPDGGWHFSYAGGAKRVSEKMGAFSHQEAVVQKWNDLHRLETDLAAGRGVFGGQLSFLELDASFPKYLVEHRDRFPGMIWPLP